MAKNKKSKKNKDKKLKHKKGAKKQKKERNTGGFPEMIAVTKAGSKDAPMLMVNSMDFANINKDTIVGVYRFRRIAHVAVTRKIKRAPQE